MDWSERADAVVAADSKGGASKYGVVWSCYNRRLLAMTAWFASVKLTAIGLPRFYIRQ